MDGAPTGVDRSWKYVTFVDPTSENGVRAFARIAEELGRRRPDIPILVVERRGTEADVTACGIDLSSLGTISLMAPTPEREQYWGVTRVCLAPGLRRPDRADDLDEPLRRGIPVIGSDRIGRAGGADGVSVLPLPERLTAESHELPTAEEVRPWVDAIIRLWDRPAAGASPSVQASATPGRPARPSLESAIAAIRRRWPDLSDDNEDDPVFVLSAGWRSGSTFLQRLIVHACFAWGEPFGHSDMIDAMAEPIRCFGDAWPEPHHFYKGDDVEALGRKFIANLNPPVRHLLQAHRAYFDRLLAEPARQAGSKRWGLKEVRLDADHAIYLHWLFPRAKFLFLIRDPYDAWRSFAARAARGWKWFKRWPDEPVTVRSFAAHWARLTSSFLEGHQKVGGLLVRYEDLKRGDFAPIEAYLGFPLSREAGESNPSDGGPQPLSEVLGADLVALREGLGPLAESLGYGPRREKGLTARPAVGVPEAGSSVAVAAASAPVPSSEVKKPAPASKCVVLVPVGNHVEPACDEALRALERRGYTVRRVRGYSAIDQGRNQIATNALRDGFEELLWIDSDVAFDPDSVERLRSHGLPVTCGVYPKKGRRSFACNFPGDVKQISFGKAGGLIEIPYAGAGFLHTRREVYQVMQERLRLPACNERFGPSMVPFFQPMIVPDGQGQWYLAEDFAFCHRARACGFRIMADTTIRLKHIGSYAYSWEDAGGERQRYGNFTFNITD